MRLYYPLSSLNHFLTCRREKNKCFIACSICRKPGRKNLGM
ncbi:MAG: hypothetical protein ACLROW_15840 [Roseburia faecis]